MLGAHSEDGGTVLLRVPEDGSDSWGSDYKHESVHWLELHQREVEGAEVADRLVALPRQTDCNQTKASVGCLAVVQGVEARPLYATLPLPADEEEEAVGESCGFVIVTPVPEVEAQEYKEPSIHSSGRLRYVSDLVDTIHIRSSHPLRDMPLDNSSVPH